MENEPEYFKAEIDGAINISAIIQYRQVERDFKERAWRKKEIIKERAWRERKIIKRIRRL